MEQEGLKVLKVKQFSILHTAESATRQIRVAQTKLALMPSPELQAGLTAYLKDLGERVRVAVASAGGKIPLSFDYIVVAERAPVDSLGATIFSMLASPFAGAGAGAGAGAEAGAGAGAEAGAAAAGGAAAGGGAVLAMDTAAPTDAHAQAHAHAHEHEHGHEHGH